MPNMCFNTLTLEASSYEELTRFYEENSENEIKCLSFDKSVHITNENGFVSGDVCCEMWGTKWEARDVEYTRELNAKTNRPTITYTFDSAWSPPTTWLHKTAELYPLIDFELEYSEGGCDFRGKQYYKNGLMIDEECEPLSLWNWNRCDKKVLENVIEANLPLITIENYGMRISNIIDDFEFETGETWENIHDYVEELVEQRLNIIPNVNIDA